MVDRGENGGQVETRAGGVYDLWVIKKQNKIKQQQNTRNLCWGSGRGHGKPHEINSRGTVSWNGTEGAGRREENRVARRDQKTGKGERQTSTSRVPSVYREFNNLLHQVNITSLDLHLGKGKQITIVNVQAVVESKPHLDGDEHITTWDR